MARKIDTSQITQTSGYPLIGNSANNGGHNRSGLDFIQLMNDERFNAILFGMSILLGSPGILWGCNLTISGGNYSITEGWIYVQGLGEMFYVPAVTTTSMGGHSYVNASWVSNADEDDPVTYSDGTTNSPHQVRTVVFTPSNTKNNGNISDPTEWFNFFQPFPYVVGAAGQPAYGAGFAANNRLAFYQSPSLASIQGDCQVTTYSQNTVFTLPNSIGILPATPVYGSWWDCNTGSGGPILVDVDGNVQLLNMSSAQNGHTIALSIPPFNAAYDPFV